ncbi:MAG: prolyl oligopeptidase family serine peptidase [Actinomycetota bacterium]
MPRTIRLALLCLTTTAALGATAPVARSQVPEGDPTDLPVLSNEVPGGTFTTKEGGRIHPPRKTVDGNISDWIGVPTRYGGTSLVSAGELVYQDHLFDAHGPDDGRDRDRLATLEPVTGTVPGGYRAESLAQADPAGEFGVPLPEQLASDDTYGDAIDHQDHADLVEVRIGIQGNEMVLLARTTTMNAAGDTALLLLADTAESSGTVDVPYNSGLTTSVAETAVFLAEGSGIVTDLADGVSTSLPAGSVAVNPAGFTNAIEARIPLQLLGGHQDVNIALAAGGRDPSGGSFTHLPIETGDDQPHANVANVAFRHDEPVRIWFEKQQALALNAGTIDDFFTTVEFTRLRTGASEGFAPGPGYHDRIFESTSAPDILKERGRDGLFQHYGVNLPTSFSGDPSPLQWWLHWRGGNAHTGAAVVPKIFKQYGEDKDTIVVSPSGRGTSTWYVGRGHVDYREVWADVTTTFPIDRDRVYVTGHSMGGWGSYLLTLLYPDRFAAAAPVAGPVTQGAWTGLDFEGCDEFSTGEESPCYIAANDSRPRDQHTRKLLENALHVPYAILHGTDDELVPYSGVARQAERLAQLGYRFRLYTYPGYEHYTHPIMDQWSEAARYLHTFVREADPARVVYKRDMLFEIATEEVQSGGATLNFDFDSAYWMSELTPVDESAGVAAFDGRSLALPETAHLAVPDTGAPTAPGQLGPYVITGIQWLPDPTAGTTEGSNAFDIDLTGARAVRLDLDRMALDANAPIDAGVSTEAPLDLRLDGGWTTAPVVTVDGAPTAASLVDGVLTVPVPAGDHVVTLGA